MDGTIFNSQTRILAPQKVGSSEISTLSTLVDGFSGLVSLTASGPTPELPEECGRPMGVQPGRRRERAIVGVRDLALDKTVRRLSWITTVSVALPHGRPSDTL